MRLILSPSQFASFNLKIVILLFLAKYLAETLYQVPCNAHVSTVQMTSKLVAGASSRRLTP